MAEQQRDLTGALFRVDEAKRKKDTWPEFEGYVMVGGKKYYLSAWVKVAGSGKKFFSLALKPAEPVAASKRSDSSWEDPF